MTYRYVDVHCHPNLGDLQKDQDGVIKRMHEEGVLGIVVGVDLESSREAVRLANEHEHLFATVGLHPNYTQKQEFNINAFEELIAEKKVVGVGECGVDYFRQSTSTPEEDVQKDWKEKQWEVFKQHVQLAQKHKKPLMIHCRPSRNSVDAYEEVADYLEDIVRSPGFAQEGEVGDLRGNMHFFVGDVEVAKRFWKLGFSTSFTGVLTFTHDYDEVVRSAPLNLLLTETDAPYAAPVPHRGEINQPVYVELVVEAIARIREESLEEIRQAMIENGRRIFSLE